LALSAALAAVLKLVLNRDPFDLDYKPTEDGEFVHLR
jgi:hypothetical protein